MTPELRQQIFALAAQDVPRRQIARQLGISEGSVRYQLDRPARPDSNGSAPADVPVPPPAHADDPLSEARRQLALEQTNVAAINLRAQRLEAERRMQLLERAPAGDQGAILLVLDAVKDLRRELDQVRLQAVARPAPAPPQHVPSELEVLERVQRTNQVLQSIAPSKPPSTAAELELQVAKDRLDLEREERMRRLDADLEERRRQLDNERVRAEAIAEQIRTWGPLIGQGVQTWLSRQGNGSDAGGAPAQLGTGQPTPGPRPGLTVLTPEEGPGVTIGMIKGPCPSCGSMLGIVPEVGKTERCPRCRMEITVVNGRIWPKLPDDGAEHFAS
jgi:hypothetical protein